MSLVLATIAPGEPEIFASLQGEGISAGRPCAFVRLSRCNLACVWCDTAYTWRFTGDNRPHVDGVAYDRRASQIALAEEEVANTIAALGQPRLVVTGGEPLLQAPALARMLALLPPMQVEVETNGTVPPPASLDGLVHQFNVSPKLRHSGNLPEIAQDSNTLALWSRKPEANFKFVIAAPRDVAEVLALADERSASLGCQKDATVRRCTSACPSLRRFVQNMNSTCPTACIFTCSATRGERER
jgi:7-carboxy-7-deazaguanine synthase